MQSQKPYEKPAIIYKDVLKTRAGSPLGQNPDIFDPANIFGED